MVDQFKEHLKTQRNAILALNDLNIEITDDMQKEFRNNGSEIESGLVGSFRKLQVD